MPMMQVDGKDGSVMQFLEDPTGEVRGGGGGGGRGEVKSGGRVEWGVYTAMVRGGEEGEVNLDKGPQTHNPNSNPINLKGPRP